MHRVVLLQLFGLLGVLAAATPSEAQSTHAAASASVVGGTGALSSGLQVKVEGRTGVDGSFAAQEVVLRDTDRSVKVEGRVAAVTPDHRRFQLVGFDVSLSRETTIYRGSQAGGSRGLIAPGAWVEARGQWRNNTIEADRLRVKDAPEATEELEAVIEQVDGHRDWLVLLGRKVRLPPGIPIVDERRGETPDAPDTTRLRRDVDDQARRPLRLGNRVIVGGRIETSLNDESNVDLDQVDDRQQEWFSRVQLVASAALTSTVEAYTKVAFSRSAVAAGPVTSALRDLRVQEAYLIADRIGGSPFGIQIGRQRFRDSREWFFDEYMDAVRLKATFTSWSLEGAIAEGIFAGDPATRSRSDKRQLLFSATRYFDIGPRLSGFVIRRDDRGPSNDDPTWLGGLAELRDHSSGWSTWALGTVRRGRRGDVPLAGWAMDAGATYRFLDTSGRPSLTLAYAHASGDAVSGDGRDTAFRQTDLEDNSARLGGFRRLSYYGELFDPELSNLRILTVGVGARPSRRLAIDLVGHRYRQDALRRSLPSSRFEDTPTTGRSRHVGYEFDAAVTLRTAWGVDFDVTGGVFVPGAAFGQAGRPSSFFRPQVRFYF